MQIIPSKILHMLEHLHRAFKEDEMRQRLDHQSNHAPSPPLRPVRRATRKSVDRLWKRIIAEGPANKKQQVQLADKTTLEKAEKFSHNIENLIGTVKVPVGVVGPLKVNGLNANGEFFVPLATTEAALVASYGRGAMVISKAGGASAAMLSQGVLRTPAFVFEGLFEAGKFVDWVASHAPALKQAAENTTRYGKLFSIEPVLDNDTVFLLCRYTTGDASGQNMVTIATDALCRHIDAHCPLTPRHRYIEGNFSGDKKASYLGLLTGRGRKVSASITLSDDLVEKNLHTTIDEMLAYASVANLGSLLSGQHGAQAHYANALAALYIATGQDAACVAEGAVGFTRMERRDDGLFVSVTLPNLLVGTVGGGTGLPSQSAALEMMGLKGAGKADALAEVAAVLCLCGEISIVAAICADHFTRAHKKLARG